KVDVKVTDPSGKEAKVYPVTMSNQSMHHEGYSFKSAGAGTYKVQISVENKGDKESGSLEFNL
ncbi:MAG: hypothetical protein KDK33_17860, partial [Leptospiraceae bacterium]|nr:hypothetical protein [Leptospiraceae bacterium]